MESGTQILQREVNAKLHIEKAGKLVGSAIGHPSDKVSDHYREQAIVHLTKAIEQLNCNHESIKVIALRTLLKFDLIRSLRGLKDVDRARLLAGSEWQRWFNQLDPLSPFTKRTTAECLIAWNHAMDLLKPFIGAKGVALQKQKLDSIAASQKVDPKKIPGKGTRRVIKAMKKEVRKINSENKKRKKKK